MRNLTLPVAALVIIVALGAVLILLPGKNVPLIIGQQGTSTPLGNDGALAQIPDLIVVGVPTKNLPVTSPLTVTGKARGTWYFEASFPIEIKDASGKVIAQGHAEAQSDWMTEEFVSFKATVTYPPQPAGSAGTLVLKNDNPSGDPARDKSLEIPIIFK